MILELASAQSKYYRLVRTCKSCCECASCIGVHFDHFVYSLGFEPMHLIPKDGGGFIMLVELDELQQKKCKPTNLQQDVLGFFI